MICILNSSYTQNYKPIPLIAYLFVLLSEVAEPVVPAVKAPRGAVDHAVVVVVAALIAAILVAVLEVVAQLTAEVDHVMAQLGLSSGDILRKEHFR